jgi:hypothetical protein
MKRWPKYLVGLAAVVALVTAYAGGPEAGEAAADSPRFIEVCSQGTVYLPPGTKLVTCQGRVMRVIAVVPLEARAEAAPDCNCPRCCDGACAVTVSCDGGGLCVAFLGC